MPILLAKILGAKVACYLVPAMLAKRSVLILPAKTIATRLACKAIGASLACNIFMIAKRMVPVLLAQWLVPVLLEKMIAVVVVVVVPWLVCGYDRWSFVVMMGGRRGRVVVMCGCVLWSVLLLLVVLPLPPCALKLANFQVPFFDMNFHSSF